MGCGPDSCAARGHASTIPASFFGLNWMFTGSWVALATPMGADNAIDRAALKRLVDFHIDAGTTGLVIAGTTGESATLEKSEHLALLEAACVAAADRIPIMAGTGSNSTAQTIALSKAACALPIVGLLTVTPYYNKPTQEGLYRHFSAIAESVDKPIVVYNVPGRTGVDMQTATVARLAPHGNVAGIKEATGEVDRVAELLAGCGEGFSLLSGDDATSREFMLAGGHGVISVTANVVPAAMAALCAAAHSGDGEGARTIDAPLADLHRDLFLESNPIPVKWALERMGLIGAGIRLPLTPLSAKFREPIEQALVNAGVSL